MLGPALPRRVHASWCKNYIYRTLVAGSAKSIVFPKKRWFGRCQFLRIFLKILLFLVETFFEKNNFITYF
jgi:hypothetical protein